MLENQDKKEIREMLKENNTELLKNFGEVFVTKTDFEEFKDEYKKDFSEFLTKIDKRVGADTDEEQEQTMLKGKVDRHEKWIGQIANKVNLKLKS